MEELLEVAAHLEPSAKREKNSSGLWENQKVASRFQGKWLQRAGTCALCARTFSMYD